MKKIILLSIALCYLTGLTIAQADPNNKNNIPFYDIKKITDAYLLKNHGIIDTIWVPVSASGISPNGKDFHWFYDYHAGGWIKTWTSIRPTEKAVRSYINHYPVPFVSDYGWTDADTTTFYSKKSEETEYTPTRRYFFDYSGYPDCLVEYRQNWKDGAWETSQKYETHYMDTLNVSRYPYLEETFNKNGQLTQGMKGSLIFDDNGNVAEQCMKLYNTDSKKYEEFGKMEYFYEKSILKKVVNYQYDKGTYMLFSMVSDIEWHEYFGFGNGKFFSWITSDRRNKCSSQVHWIAPSECTREEPAWEFDGVQKTHWNTEGTFSVHDTIYRYNPSWDTLHFFYGDCYYHDDHGNKRMYKNIGYYSPSYSGNFGDTMLYALDSMVNQYDSHNQCYRYDRYMERYANMPKRNNTNGIEYSYDYCEVDSFRWYLPLAIDEKLPASPPMLKILPNPSGDGTVQIIADKEMRRISVYTLEGKMVYDSPVSGKEALISTAPLSQGIYIVQALLKNGNKQTGKLVIK